MASTTPVRNSGAELKAGTRKVVLESLKQYEKLAINIEPELMIVPGPRVRGNQADGG